MRNNIMFFFRRRKRQRLMLVSTMPSIITMIQKLWRPRGQTSIQHGSVLLAWSGWWKTSMTRTLFKTISAINLLSIVRRNTKEMLLKIIARSFLDIYRIFNLFKIMQKCGRWYLIHGVMNRNRFLSYLFLLFLHACRWRGGNSLWIGGKEGKNYPVCNNLSGFFSSVLQP